MFSPEHHFARKYEQAEEPLTMEEQAAYNVYVPRWRDAEPRLDSFREIHGDVVVQSDKKFVAEREREESDKHERGQLLEALLYHSLDREDWLGERAYVVRTSEFDDKVNGTDLVVEFQRDDADPVRLAIDVTATRNKDTIRSKVAGIRDDVRRGMLTALKYFRSEINEDVSGSVSNLPRVIVGLEPESVSILAEIFAKRHSDDVEVAKKASHIIAEHPFQIKLLEEISLQLKRQLQEVAEHTPEDRRDVLTTHIQEVRDIIDAVLEEKQKTVPPRTVREDRTTRLLSDELDKVW